MVPRDGHTRNVGVRGTYKIHSLYGVWRAWSPQLDVSQRSAAGIPKVKVGAVSGDGGPADGAFRSVMNSSVGVEAFLARSNCVSVFLYY